MDSKVELGPRATRDLDVEIGRRVHLAIWDLKMSQAEFSDRIGMSPSSVAKRLRGYHPWSASHLVQVAEVLNTSVAFLVGEAEPVAHHG